MMAKFLFSLLYFCCLSCFRIVVFMAIKKINVATTNIARKIVKKFLFTIRVKIVSPRSPENKVPIRPPATQPETRAKEESIEVKRAKSQGKLSYFSKLERLSETSLNLKSKNRETAVSPMKPPTKKNTPLITKPPAH